MLKNRILFSFLLIGWLTSAFAQNIHNDKGDQFYTNPIIHADYSDPDVESVGDDFYMVASSFNGAPGLPVLHSKDLVHWKIVNHVFQRQIPDSTFSFPQHGNGAWAPSIRYHDGYYYVYYGDPDFGIYMSKTKDPRGEWSRPHLVRGGKGLIDPCPLWDEDGKAYLVHAFAGSRASIKSILVVHEMSPEGTELLDDGVLVFDGHAEHGTIEGPKFYKRNGYYYIFAPAGGVSTGWQTVLRSKNVFGPYEIKTVMHQGETDINGPHQGGWLALENGEHWFIHFQDKGAYGRIVHLQPMMWKDDWCVIGVDEDGDGIGEPVTTFKKPDLEPDPDNVTPQTSDDFTSNRIGLQWQWQANPQANWAFPLGAKGQLRIYAVEAPENYNNLWDVGSLLLQKFPALEFSAVTKLTFSPAARKNPVEKMGLVVMGLDYSYIALKNENDQLSLQQVVCKNADQGEAEIIVAETPFESKEVYLKVQVKEGGICQFSYSSDGKRFIAFGESFAAREGKWIGAKVGLFGWRDGTTNDSGYADFDFFNIEN